MDLIPSCGTPKKVIHGPVSAHPFDFPPPLYASLADDFRLLLLFWNVYCICSHKRCVGVVDSCCVNNKQPSNCGWGGKICIWAIFTCRIASSGRFESALHFVEHIHHHSLQFRVVVLFCFFKDRPCNVFCVPGAKCLRLLNPINITPFSLDFV